MDYARQQRNPSRHLVGIGGVILFHALLIYGLVNGLARKIVEVVKGPIEVKVIEEVKAPPPPPAEIVPPPPQLAAPPPPFIPPPEINIAPPPTPAPTITAVTREAPPAPVAPVIQPPPPPVAVHPVAGRVFVACAGKGSVTKTAGLIQLDGLWGNVNLVRESPTCWPLS